MNNEQTNECCTDDRFGIIARAKEALIKGTNIADKDANGEYYQKEEMKVLDNFLFRCWQMGWLNKYESTHPIHITISPADVANIKNALRREIAELAEDVMTHRTMYERCVADNIIGAAAIHEQLCEQSREAISTLRKLLNDIEQ